MTHIEKATELFDKKFHCSQAVLAAFADELGITEQQALKIGACFGSGMRKGEVCGACTGALMAAIAPSCTATFMASVTKKILTAV